MSIRLPNNTSWSWPGLPTHCMVIALTKGVKHALYQTQEDVAMDVEYDFVVLYKSSSSPFWLERTKDCDTLQEISMHINTRFLIPIIIIIPRSYGQSLCNSTTVLRTVCAGNEDKVLSYGCAQQPESLTIEYCKSHCRCGAGNQLQCPEYVTCFDEKINATEKCGSPYIWSCGCSG